MRLARQAALVHGAGQLSLEGSGVPQASERRLRLVHRATSVRPVPRLAAVLVADIVAYSRHMAEDETGTLPCSSRSFATSSSPASRARTAAS
jgi:class 3 adenylate cyclase